MNRSEIQKKYQRETQNASTKKYEKTKAGFLMRVYRNMKSRIEGVQKSKFNLYRDKSILPKEDFYKWSYDNSAFHILFAEWENSGYLRKLTPSIDRINPSIGYTIENIRFITMSENSRIGAESPLKKKRVIQIDKNGNTVKVWESLTVASKSIGRNNPGNIIHACKGNIKSAYGFKWAYA